MGRRQEVTRRDVVTAGAAALTAAASLEVRAQEPRRVGAADKVVVGIIGLGPRGFGHHLHTFAAFPDVEIGAVCDVYTPHLERAVAATNGRARAYSDYNKLVEDKALDAVIIATPPHWHALMACAALSAGKDVLCEKPMSRFPAEGRLMAELAKRYSRVTQVGTQIHATDNYHNAVDVVRSGLLGQITAVRTFCALNNELNAIGTPADEAPPPGLDWKAWLGPAPQINFNPARFRRYAFFRDYVDSWLHELGPHIVDLPFWALELGPPRTVSASGGRYATISLADVPDTLDVIWSWPNLNMTWSLTQHSAFHFGVQGPREGRNLGIVFQGREGTLLANYDVCDVADKVGKPVLGRTYPRSTERSPGHEREFINAVRTRRECSCSFARALPMHTALNLAHLSLRLGRTLHWDRDKWEVKGDREATRLLTPEYRNGLRFPKT